MDNNYDQNNEFGKNDNGYTQYTGYNHSNGFNNAETGWSAPQPQRAKSSKPKLPFWLGLLIGIFCTLVVVLIIVALSGAASGRRTGSKSSDSYTDKVDTIKTYIDRYYVGELSDEEMEDALAKGLLNGIGDKYAQYWSPEEYAAYMEAESGTYAGIGVSVVWNDDNKCEVYKVYTNSPAQEAGLQVKDLIVAVDGNRDFEDLDGVVALVRGEAGSEVELTLEREGKELTVVSRREVIQVEAVEYRMMEDNIGYIYISQFLLVADEQFNAAVDSLLEQGARALILDLRDNPGGDYDTVVAMCDRVLPEGVIISVEDSSGVEKVEYSDAENYLDIPMVCLINGNSASASEVFVGALQDYKVATVIGEQSYGKGVVQSVFTLYDGSGMKFTTERYYTPNGHSLDGVGITPDIEVKIPEEAYEDGMLTEDEDTQLQKAIDFLSTPQAASR